MNRTRLESELPLQMGRSFKREGINIYLWLILVEV